MNEHDAKLLIASNYRVSRETLEKLERYRAMLIDANRSQNLISRSTEDQFWSRHALDSAQLIAHVPDARATWLDVGTGAGLPGLVLATMTQDRHVLVDARRLRVVFVQSVVDALSIGHRVEVRQDRVERLEAFAFSVITARAFSSLTNTLRSTVHLADAATVWLLNKGARASEEVAEARAEWDADFDMIPSVTDPAASIVRVRNLQGRCRP